MTRPMRMTVWVSVAGKSCATSRALFSIAAAKRLRPVPLHCCSRCIETRSTDPQPSSHRRAACVASVKTTTGDGGSSTVREWRGRGAAATGAGVLVFACDSLSDSFFRLAFGNNCHYTPRFGKTRRISCPARNEAAILHYLSSCFQTNLLTRFVSMPVSRSAPACTSNETRCVAAVATAEV